MLTRNRKDHEGTCAIGYSQATYIRYILIHEIHYGLYFDVLDVRSGDILVNTILSKYQGPACN